MAVGAMPDEIRKGVVTVPSLLLLLFVPVMVSYGRDEDGRDGDAGYTCAGYMFITVQYT